MTFSLADLALMTIAGYFILSGLHRGFIRTAGSLIGLVGGIVIATQAITWLSSYIQFADKPFWTAVFFLLVLSICAQIISWVFVLADRAWKILSIIPFLGSINKLLGGIVGLIEALAVIAMIGYGAEIYLSEGALQTAILSSQVLAWTSFATDILRWILSFF